MRKYLIGIAVSLIAMASAGAAQADPIQSLDAAISPTKLDKKKPKSVELFIDIKTNNNAGAATFQDQPPTQTRTVVDFPKNLKFDTGAVPPCQGSQAALSNTTTEQAIEICGKKSIISKASGTSAHVTADAAPTIPNPDATISIPVVVTAFNGTEKNTFFFHNRADTVNNTTVLFERLVKAKPPYGTSLITEIPPLLAGAPDDFKTTVKKGTIVSGVCKSKRNPFRLTTTFSDYTSPTVTDTTETTCKQKKPKKK